MEAFTRLPAIDEVTTSGEAGAKALTHQGLPVDLRIVPEESFGPFGSMFALDQPASSAHTRSALRWQPKHPSLLDDLENIQP